MSDKQKTVLMIVTNPCVNDSRVIKSAETLARTGYSVYVYCRESPQVNAAENRNGVSYVRIPMVFSLLPGVEHESASSPAQLTVKPPEEINIHRSTYSFWPIILLICYMPATLIFIMHKLMRPIISLMQARWKKKNGVSERSVESRYEKILHYEYGSINAIAQILFYMIKRLVLNMARLVKNITRYSRSNIKRSLRPPAIKDKLKLVKVVRTSCLADMVIDLKPDVIHAHDFATLPASTRLASLSGAHLIYDSHELEAHRNGISAAGRIQVSYMEKYYIRKADAVITVCDSIADYLARKYDIAQPTVVMNAPDVEDSSHDGESIRTDIGLTDTVPLAVYVGKITTGRGLLELVKAMSHVAEFHVAMLGPSVAAIERQLIEVAVSLGVNNRLHILPPVSPGIVMSYIKSADIGVIPIQDICLSYRYCMPNKLFEMAFSGIPACVSNLPEMKAFIEREHTGISMDQTDPHDIARAMSELYRRRDEFVVDDERLVALYCTYSWEAQGKRLIALYDSILHVH